VVIFDQDKSNITPSFQLDNTPGNIDPEIAGAPSDFYNMLCHDPKIPKYQKGIKLFFSGAPGTVRTFAAGVTL